MYGWILSSFESTILNKYGPEKWKEIQEMAECSVKTGEFIKNVHYSDDLINGLIMASTRILNVPQDQLIEELGENFLNFIRENGYDSTIRSQGSNFSEFLVNLNEPHRLLRSRFPDSYLPEFWCTNFKDEDEKTHGCILHYYSQRGTLFAPMVVGLLRKLGKELYNVVVELNMISQTCEETYIHTVWTVKFVDLPREESESRQLSVHSTESTTNRVLKCPFSSRSRDSTKTSKKSSPSKLVPVKSVEVGLNYKRLSQLFPFHVLVNQDLEIIQYGSRIRSFLTLDPTREVYSMEDIFAFQSPPGLTWSWETVLSFSETAAELFAMRLEGNITFRGNVMILDPSTDPGIDEPCALFLISPVLYNLEELENLNMKLSDFPLHTFQRDLLVVGEHIKLEQSAALRLDVLSRKLEEEGKKSLNSLKTKRAFVRYVSHEVRSPLNIALLGLRFLADQVKKSIMPEKVEVEDVLSEVRNSCCVAVDILNDLLLYEKFDDGMFTLAKNESRIAEYFPETVSVYKVQAKSAEVEFQIISHGVDNVIVNIDGTKFSQVIRNLLSNALKFTPKGGKVIASCSLVAPNQIDPHIHFAEMPAGIKEQFETEFSSSQASLGYVRISIKDSGAGISPENQRLMFNQFIQFNADKLQQGQGSGLGLWIASSIMHLHGGRIGVFSEGEGKGTEFVADLPIFRIDTNPLRTGKNGSKAKQLLHYEIFYEKLKSIRLLIVDDSSMNRKIVRRVLEGKFDTIHEAENGLEATKMCKEAFEHHHPYHLIMMDSQMPVMNGLDATKFIKSLLEQVTIVGVTGNALKHEVDNFIDAGADKVMVKPLNLEEFFDYVCDLPEMLRKEQL